MARADGGFSTGRNPGPTGAKCKGDAFKAGIHHMLMSTHRDHSYLLAKRVERANGTRPDYARLPMHHAGCEKLVCTF